MKTRVISGAILALILIPTLLIGGWLLYGINLCVALVGMFELYRVKKIQNTALAYIAYVAVTLFYILMVCGLQPFYMLLIVLTVLALMTAYVASFPKYQTEDVLLAFLGVFYVGCMLSYVYEVRALTDGIYIVWLIFVASWINDTCAYFAGVTFGKHKMTPKLSPKKSVEGGIGGVLGATIVGAVYGGVLQMLQASYLPYPIVTFALASCIGALFAIVGDLAASAIKRNYGIKDYGTLIPGHGGIMDRFDSVIFTAPAVYWAVVFVQMLFA